MTYFEAFLYGAVQGLTEYLPVSSSAHLILLPRFLKTQDPGLTFDVFLHLGTLIATLSFFWKDWLAVFSGIPGIGPSFRKFLPLPAGVSSELPSHFWILIVVGTLPALLAGALLHHWIESSFRGNEVIAMTLAGGGVLLYLADRYGAHLRTWVDIELSHAVGIGLGQCLALLPGFSRSGSTIMMGRFLGFDRTASARFSFLLSAPITFAAIIFELRHWRELLGSQVSVGPLFVAGLSSFVFGWVAIGGLLHVVKRFGYLSFAIYRVALAGVIWKCLGV